MADFYCFVHLDLLRHLLAYYDPAHGVPKIPTPNSAHISTRIVSIAMPIATSVILRIGDSPRFNEEDR